MIFRAHSATRVVAAVLVVLLTAGPSYAQQPAQQPAPPPQNTVAKLIDMEGNVLVSRGDAMVAGSNDQRLPAGTRIVTTAGAKVTINYDVGCDVKLNENQRFTVSVGPCAALLAQVENLGPAAGAIGGGEGAVAAAGGTGGIGTIAGVGALAAAVIGAVVAARKNTVSPS
jgi:hypothetical protein